MNIRLILFAAILTISIAIGCVQPPDYPSEPVIEFMSFNQNAIAQGNQNAASDTLAITFSFTDGEGDIGFPEEITDTFDIMVTDSRNNFVNTFRSQVIPDQGTGNGVSGEITIKMPNKPFNICCTPPVAGQLGCDVYPEKPIDTVSFTIQLLDRAGNYSNRIQTDILNILCQ